MPIIKDVGSLTFVEILLLLFSLLREYVCVVTPWPSLYEPVGIGAREPVAQRSQRNWMMHPGSVGMNPSSPWVTFHRCKRGDGRGPGHVHSPSPFAFPETAPGHLLPLQAMFCPCSPLREVCAPGGCVRIVAGSQALTYHTSFHSFSYLTFFSSPSLPWVCLPNSNNHALVFASVCFRESRLR